MTENARSEIRIRHKARSTSGFGLGALLLLGLASAAGCGSGDDDDDGAAGTGASAGSQGSGASGGNSGSSSKSGTGGTGASGGSSSKGGSGNGAGKGGGSGKGGSGGSSTTGGSSSKAGESGSDAGGSDGGGSGGTGGSGGSGGTGAGSRTQAETAEKLGREPNFMFGMGNDLDNDHNKDGAYTLGVTLDLHYAYLVGLQGKGGWPDWNPGGYFVTILADTADAHGVTPMFDLYSMAAQGEGNLDKLDTDAFMQGYWDTLRLLYQRLGDFDKPALVHLEPDFWAFAQQQSGGDPTSIPARVGSLVSECEGEPENLVGLGHCMIELGRTYSPKTLISFHASHWAGDSAGIVSFLTALGGADTDLITMDMLDRDAGCFEVGNDPNCTRNDGPWYWDETNTTSPNFHDYLGKSKEIGDGLGLPILWWQLPFGVPSDEPGGEPGAYRDNRVRYIFSHVQEFIDAGGVGAVFGVGSGNQTYITTDGDQFKNAVTGYYADPVPLP